MEDFAMNGDFNLSYFMDSWPSILGNSELREPQIESYVKTIEHFNGPDSTMHAIIQIPTGVGKTGIMGILPFGISKGRVLIITPNITIRDTVTEALDPNDPENFYIQRKVFETYNDLPCLVEYDKKKNNSVLQRANIIILNIHKLQVRSINSLIHRLPQDFFDMIIIDEAHHSPARTWREAVNHFSSAKVIKLTATPFRTDGICLVGKKIYEYRLSRAMHQNYVKSLRMWEHVPGKLELTLDDNIEKTYTIDEILSMKIKDEQWIRRSVAFSPECCESVVRRSLELLNEKKIHSALPHKIIAVAASIKHAQMIQTLYNDCGARTVIIHSDLEDEERDKAFSDIANHRVDVVVQVSMLNEGYDHCFLSIAAIFRPFQSYLPYTQFVGRILRIIPNDYSPSAEDNIGQVVSHKHLALDELWKYYKREIDESNIISFTEATEDTFDETEQLTNRKNDFAFGKAHEEGMSTFTKDEYLTTELLMRAEKDSEEYKVKEQELMKLLGISSQQAREYIRQSKRPEQFNLKRPDLIDSANRKSIDARIKQEIVPQLLVEHGIPAEGSELADCRVFKDSKYQWITKKGHKNAALLSIYFNQYLMNRLGKKREEWSIDEFATAFTIIDGLCEYMNSILADL